MSVQSDQFLLWIAENSCSFRVDNNNSGQPVHPCILIRLFAVRPVDSPGFLFYSCEQRVWSTCACVNLRMRAVWKQFLLSAHWMANDTSFLRVKKEYSVMVQSVYMLILVQIQRPCWSNN